MEQYGNHDAHSQGPSSASTSRRQTSGQRAQRSSSPNTRSRLNHPLPHLLQRDSSPEHFVSVPSPPRHLDRGTAPGVTVTPTSSSSRPSMSLSRLDADAFVQLANPAHPDHNLWLERNRMSSPTSRRKKVPTLDPEDPAYIDSSPAASRRGSHTGGQLRAKVHVSGPTPRSALPSRDGSLHRPASSVRSPDSSSDDAVSFSRPRPPRSRERHGDRPPHRPGSRSTHMSGSSSEARTAARKRRKKRTAAMIRPPPPALPPRTSSSAAFRAIDDEDDVEGLPPLEKAVYPLSLPPWSSQPSPREIPRIHHRISSNPVLRASAQAGMDDRPPPLPAKAVRLLGPDAAIMSKEDFIIDTHAREQPAADNVETTRGRRGRSVSLDLLRETLNLFPQRSESPMPMKQKGGSTASSRIRASFDAVRPRLMSLTRLNDADASAETDVISVASEALATTQKSEGKMKKNLRSIRSVLRLRMETEPAMTTSKPISKSAPSASTQSYSRSTRSMDLIRGSVPFWKDSAPPVPPLPGVSSSRSPNDTRRDFRSASHPRLSLVGEEVDPLQLERTSIESQRSIRGSTMKPASPNNPSIPGEAGTDIIEQRRPSTTRIAPQLSTVMEVSHDGVVQQPISMDKKSGRPDEQADETVQRSHQWPVSTLHHRQDLMSSSNISAIHRERSFTEPIHVQSNSSSRRPAGRMRTLPTFGIPQRSQSSTVPPSPSLPLHLQSDPSQPVSPLPTNHASSRFAKGRRGLLSSLWGRSASSTSGSKQEFSSPLSTPSDPRQDTSLTSFGSLAPSMGSSTGGEATLRSALEAAYIQSYGACGKVESTPFSTRPQYHDSNHDKLDPSSGMFGLGVDGRERDRDMARQLSSDMMTNPSDFDPEPQWSRSNSLLPTVYTPAPGKGSPGRPEAYETSEVHAIGRVDSRTPISMRDFSQQGTPLGTSVKSLQIDGQGATGRDSTSTPNGMPPLPHTVRGTPPSKSADTLRKVKRSPFMEVVAAGRKSFSRDRGRQAAQHQRTVTTPDSEALPTIHKSLGPVLLSDANVRANQWAGGEEEQENVEEAEDEPWDGMDVEDEASLHYNSSLFPLPATSSFPSAAVKDDSPPSLDSRFPPQSLPSPPTSPAASLSNSQWKKSGTDADKPLPPDPSEALVRSSAKSETTDLLDIPPVVTPSSVRDIRTQSASESPPASSFGSPSFGETSLRSFGGHRASQGRHASPPAVLQLSPNFQQTLATPPLPAKCYQAKPDLSLTQPFTPSLVSRDSPGKLSTPTSKHRGHLHDPSPIASPVGTLQPVFARKGDWSPPRTSFSMDRDRSPVASPYVPHAATTTSGQRLRSAFRKLGISHSVTSGLSSHAMKSIGSTISSGTTASSGSSHMKKGISSESHLNSANGIDSEEEHVLSAVDESTGNRLHTHDLKWSHSSPSLPISNLNDSQDSSLAAARAATQMLQVHTEGYLPSPSSTPVTMTAPTKLVESSSVSPLYFSRTRMGADRMGDEGDKDEEAYGSSSTPRTARARSPPGATPPRPPRNRGVTSPKSTKSVGVTAASPSALSAGHEGASSSSGSYATPTSSRFHGVDDLSDFDAMLRAQKIREAEMFRNISARSRMRSRVESISMPTSPRIMENERVMEIVNGHSRAYSGGGGQNPSAITPTYPVTRSAGGPAGVMLKSS